MGDIIHNSGWTTITEVIKQCNSQLRDQYPEEFLSNFSWVNVTQYLYFQHWFRQWLGAAITWANVYPDPCDHMVSLSHHELKSWKRPILTRKIPLWTDISFVANPCGEYTVCFRASSIRSHYARLIKKIAMWVRKQTSYSLSMRFLLSFVVYRDTKIHLHAMASKW